MIFRQFIDPETSTLTYLLADESTREAVLIDSVLEQFDRDRTLLRELDLTLRYTLETHVHADHITAADLFRREQGSRVAVSAAAGVKAADIEFEDGDVVRFGSATLEVCSTPGHTGGCVTYLCREQGMAFTGDALLIRGCGRTDFQQGDAAALFDSVRNKIFSLPDETLLFPGHDYKGRMVTTVGEEKRFNPRLGLDKSEADFVAIVDRLDLAYPKRIDVAVPANLECGLLAAPIPAPTSQPSPSTASSVASVMEAQGRQDAEIWMGMGI
ncbi:MAG: MBL fold metallo-hydrolase [Myxococcales bacterium]|nr:MBL fold metallo-hydrolase [Myxococcales bacterium]